MASSLPLLGLAFYYWAPLFLVIRRFSSLECFPQLLLYHLLTRKERFSFLWCLSSNPLKLPPVLSSNLFWEICHFANQSWIGKAIFQNRAGKELILAFAALMSNFLRIFLKSGLKQKIQAALRLLSTRTCFPEDQRKSNWRNFHLNLVPVLPAKLKPPKDFRKHSYLSSA